MPPPTQEPYVGQSVHFVANGHCLAAIITAVYGNGGVADMLDVVDLCVLASTALAFNLNVPFDESRSVQGTWHTHEACAKTGEQL